MKRRDFLKNMIGGSVAIICPNMTIAAHSVAKDESLQSGLISFEGKPLQEPALVYEPEEVTDLNKIADIVEWSLTEEIDSVFMHQFGLGEPKARNWNATIECIEKTNRQINIGDLLSVQFHNQHFAPGISYAGGGHVVSIQRYAAYGSPMKTTFAIKGAGQLLVLHNE